MARLLASVLVMVFFGLGCSTTPIKPSERAQRAVKIYKAGVATFEQGDLGGAISQFNEALRLQPDYTLLRFDLGRALIIRAEQRDVASLQSTERAKDLRSENDAKSAVDEETKARALHAQAQTDLNAALGHLLFAEQRLPFEPNVYFLLAKVHTGLGQFDEARGFLQKAIDEGKPSGPTRTNLEEALRRLEQYAEAQKLAEDD